MSLELLDLQLVALNKLHEAVIRAAPTVPKVVRDVVLLPLVLEAQTQLFAVAIDLHGSTTGGPQPTRPSRSKIVIREYGFKPEMQLQDAKQLQQPPAGSLLNSSLKVKVLKAEECAKNDLSDGQSTSFELRLPCAASRTPGTLILDAPQSG